MYESYLSNSIFIKVRSLRIFLDPRVSLLTQRKCAFSLMTMRLGLALTKVIDAGIAPSYRIVSVNGINFKAPRRNTEFKILRSSFTLIVTQTN